MDRPRPRSLVRRALASAGRRRWRIALPCALALASVVAARGGLGCAERASAATARPTSADPGTRASAEASPAGARPLRRALTSPVPVPELERRPWEDVVRGAHAREGWACAGAALAVESARSPYDGSRRATAWSSGDCVYTVLADGPGAPDPAPEAARRACACSLALR